MSAIDLDLQLQLGRSRCIDAFADTENAISALSKQLCPGHDAEAFAQKIKRLRGVAAGPQYSRAQRTKLHEHLQQLEDLAPIRNDLAHGKLQVAHVGKTTVAIFLNAREADKLAPLARIVSNDQFLEIEAKAARLAVLLREPLAKTTSHA